MSETIRDVIIIGGGISGLSAAKLLKEYNLDVIVLEARNRVGGRTFTKRDKRVNYVDLGGAYIGPGQDRILRLIKEFNLETYKVNDIEDIVHLKNGKTIRFSSDRNPSVGGIIKELDLNNIFRLIDKMGEQIPSDQPWNAPKAIEWDRMTFKEFLDQNTWTTTAEDFAKLFIRVCITSEPYESSLLWFLWYVKQCGGTRTMFSTTNGEQERKVVGGTQQISEKMAEFVGTDRVLLDKPVVGITESNNEVVVQTLDTNQYKSKFIIMALAPPMQHKIHYEPPLPPLRNQLNQRCPMGSVMKVIVYYETTFWRKINFCGSLMIEGFDEYPVSFTLDDTKPDGTFPAIMGFIAADKCRKLHQLTKQERLRRITQSFAKAWNTDEALRPIHYEEYNWMEEQYSGGCYTTLCPPGFLTTFGKFLRQPIGRMYFAGTETATQWSGYMEGAVQAGERAAREILVDMGKIDADQIWQIEPESEEVPHYCFKSSFLESNMPSVTGLIVFSSLLALGLVAVTPFILQKYNFCDIIPKKIEFKVEF